MAKLYKENEWITVYRPGQFGKIKNFLYDTYFKWFGKEEVKWRLRWEWGEDLLPQEIAIQKYEDAYLYDSLKREELWLELINEASDVYDNSETNVESGFDYNKQETKATHLQDIAIRRVVRKRNWKFKGKKLIQIRSHDTYWGDKLSPGRVKFHKPEKIKIPHLKGWWDENSVEDFYQSNKVLQIRKK